MRLVVLPKMDNPLIGSGKIPRRCLISKPKRKRKKQINYNRTLRRTSKADKLNYGSASVKLAFQLWCQLGFPFTTHKPTPSKVVLASITSLKKAIKQHGHNEVVKAIEVGHVVFNSKWFKFKIKKISCRDFMRYRQTTKRTLNDELSKVDSWLEECLKGKEYLENAYSFKIKDRYPAVTKGLHKLWEEIHGEDYEILPNEENAFILCSRRIMEFCKVNPDIDELTVIGAMKRVLDNGNFKPEHARYLVGDNFWRKAIPNSLVKFGVYQYHHQIKKV